MNTYDVERAYNILKQGLHTVGLLEHALVKEAYSFEKWTNLLQRKSAKIRALYMDVNPQIDSIMLEFTKHPEKITPELADMFITHIDFFTSEGYRDSQAVIPILSVLIPYFEKHGPVYRLFDSYYYMAIAILEQRRYEDAAFYFTKTIEMSEQVTELYHEFRIMCSYYFRLLAEVCAPAINIQRIIDSEVSALNAWKNADKRLFKPYQIQAAQEIFYSLCGMAIMRLLDDGEQLPSQFAEILEAQYEETWDSNCKTYVLHYKYLLSLGKITPEEYTKALREQYFKQKSEFENGFSYGTISFVDLFDDELPYDEFNAGRLSFMNPSYNYICYLLPELLRYDCAEEIQTEAFTEISRYYADMPIVRNDFLIDYLIEYQIQKIFIHVKDEEYVLSLLEKVYMRRQATTVIHCHMVCAIANTIANELLEKTPELFLGLLPETNTISQVLQHKEEILTYVQHAARCHDIGKIICSDIINLQLRRISDEEFGIIKQHPLAGYRILEHIPVLEKYKNVALGHHRFYDESRGYPEEFSRVASPEQTVIDLITLCDCIDAATDQLGRNYAQSKDFTTVLAEFESYIGSRYNGLLIEQITNNIELIQRIRDITTLHRPHIYYEVYQTLVEPDVSFRPMDERYIRVCNLSDLEILEQMGVNEFGELQELYEKCIHHKYLLVNGYGKIFAYLFGTPNGKVFDLHHIVVERSHRRKGYGSELLRLFESIIITEGFQTIRMPAITEGHYEKFCWHNGFHPVNIDGYMEKQLT